MATKTITICDRCHEYIAPGAEGKMVLTLPQGRKEADLCGECAAELPGQMKGKPGRPKKAEVGEPKTREEPKEEEDREEGKELSSPHTGRTPSGFFGTSRRVG